MRRGFSLIELLIVIGLIALVGSLLVVNAQAILRGLGEEPVDRILQKAVREARFQAAYLKEPVRLRFDEESMAFLITGEAGNELGRFPTGLDESDSLETTFEQILPEEGLFHNNRLQTTEIPAIVFRPDRSSTPFQVTIEQGSASGFTLRYDPFSDIVIHDSRED